MKHPESPYHPMKRNLIEAWKWIVVSIVTWLVAIILGIVTALGLLTS